MRHVPVRVQAHLQAGVALPPWGIALDGLLAAQLWAAAKAGHRSAGTGYERARDSLDPPDLDLPLARCTTDPGGLWHWAATFSHPAHQGGDVHLWRCDVDHRTLEHTATALPKVVSSRQGRYRSYLMPLVVTVTSHLTWRAVGDRDAIAALLAPVTWIGKKRGQGEGQVVRWQVEEDPGVDPFEAAHLHPDHSLGRPCPPTCRQRLGLPEAADGGTGTAGLRPPYMHPARQHTLALPVTVTG